METLSPIPSPSGHRWREFRIKVMPALVFFVVLAAVAVTWKQYVAAPSVVGEVEDVRVNVINTRPGLLEELNVERFQSVTKGQVIGRMLITEPEELKASLTVIEMDLKMLRAQMALDEQRNELNYEQFRLDYLARRAELAVARASLKQAESEMQRVTQLHKDKIASDLEMDVAARDQEKLRSEVAEKTKLVTQVEESLERLSPAATGKNPRAEFITAAIDAQQNKLMLLEGPVILKAPTDGVISAINHRPGEKIMAGDPIVTIGPAHPERIVGYVRQPLKIIPKAGDAVQVRTRGPTRQTGVAKVLKVGADMQAVTAPLRIRGYDTSQERGLPFLVEVPAGMEVYPGELVDLIIRQ